MAPPVPWFLVQALTVQFSHIFCCGVRGFRPGFPAFKEGGLFEELSPAVYMCLSHLGTGVRFKRARARRSPAGLGLRARRLG